MTARTPITTSDGNAMATASEIAALGEVVAVAAAIAAQVRSEGARALLLRALDLLRDACPESLETTEPAWPLDGGSGFNPS